MLEELIDTYERLKKYIFIINRGNNTPIIIRFRNDNFYHLTGLHKTNINMFFPNYIKSKDKQYKYLKKNIERFNNILENQIQDKFSLELRIRTFKNLIDMLSNDNKNTSLYNLKEKVPGSMYDGDFGLLRIFEEYYCLLGLKVECNDDNFIYCVPQSWMASLRANKLIENKLPIYMDRIDVIPQELFNEELFIPDINS